MKKLFFLLLVTLLFAAPKCFAQKMVSASTTLGGIGYEIVQINSSSYGNGNYAIGKDTSDTGDINIYRTYFDIDLTNPITFPPNTEFTKVTVRYDNGPFYGYSLKLTKLSSISGQQSSNWSAIGNGSTLDSGLPYNGNNYNSTAIKNALNNAFSNGHLYIGALSESESTIGSNAPLTLYLDVEYKYPARELTIHSRNDLNGDDGGNIGVGIYPDAATSHQSPYQLYPNPRETDTLNLAAYDNQNVNSKIWFFNDTEVPSNKSEWKKLNNGNYTSLGNTQTIRTQALPYTDNNATFIAYLKTNSYTTSGTMAASEEWFTDVNLTGNVLVPSGVTLTITSDATVNLVNGSNRYSIISTGGSIAVDNGATINGLRATLTANPTLRGLCGTIQAAADYAGSTNEIYLENGNFNENVNIYNKFNLSIFGNPNYNPFDNLTVTSCTAFEAVGFGTTNVYVYNSSYLVLYSLNAYGTYQRTIGFYLYNSDTYDVSYLTSEYSRIGISCWDGTEADIEESFLYDNRSGLESSNGSNVNIYNSFFCGTASDLTTYNFSSIRATSCYFDGGIPSTSGSNIIHIGDQSCSFSKAASNQPTENNMENIEGPEFEKINSAYFSLNKKLAKAFKEKTDFNKEAFCMDYDQIIKDFKKFINNNPESPLAKVALVASAKSYRRIDDLRGKNDFADMKNFLSGIIEKSEYAELKPQAERLMIEYYRLKKDFTEAIETADNIIGKYKEDSDYLCGVLFAKGLILAYDLNKTDKASECFSYIVQKYPESNITLLAENELRILGIEIKKDVKENPVAEDNLGFSTSSYPNPFNPTTTISYTIPKDGKVEIKVYDALGREVTTLVNEVKPAGKYNVVFNAANLASGVYFYRLTVNDLAVTKKIILMK